MIKSSHGHNGQPRTTQMRWGKDLPDLVQFAVRAFFKMHLPPEASPLTGIQIVAVRVFLYDRPKALFIDRLFSNKIIFNGLLYVLFIDAVIKQGTI